MSAPRAPRRPFRTVGVSPAGAWLLMQFRRADPAGFEEFTGRMARRHLDMEERLTFAVDLEELERMAADWASWRSFDIEHANPAGSNMPPRLSHDDEITAPQAAAELGMSPQHIGRLVRSGELVGRKAGPRSLMVTRASVKTFKDQRKAS